MLLIVLPNGGTWQLRGVPTTPPGDSFHAREFPTFDEAAEAAMSWLSGAG